MDKFASHPKLAQIDFMVPTMSRELKEFIPRPCSYSRALRWLKEALNQVTCGEDIKTITWHSMRVFMPDCALQAQIPQEQRQYLGNWATASTADVYTRDKRNVVCKLWTQVCSRLGSLQTNGDRTARVDLDHPDYKVDPAPLETLDLTHPTSEWEVLHRGTSPTGTIGPDTAEEAPPQDKVPADLLKPPRGPLTVVCRTTKVTSKNTWTTHLFDTEGKGMGCGWKPSQDKYREVLQDDMKKEPDTYTQCSKCFRFYTWPSTWSARQEQEEDDSSSSVSSGPSLTDDSDKEQITLE
jgi:hypothetical protein